MVLRMRGAFVAMVLGLMIFGFQFLWLQKYVASQSASVVYQKNLLFVSDQQHAVVADIKKSGPSIVTLQEVSARNKIVLDQLKDQFPNQAYCPFNRVGGVAVLSDLPRTRSPIACLEGQGLVAMQVRHPTGPLWVVSLHLHWPFPHRQAEHSKRLAAFLEKLEGDIVIGGDFNMVRGGASIKRILAATGTDFVGQSKVTFHLKKWPYLPFRIDHVLASGSGSLSIRPKLGSDHNGLMARIDF